MEIKINFDQLFEPSNELNTTQETPSSHPSPSLRSLSDSFDYQLALDPQLFPSPSTHTLLADPNPPSEKESGSLRSQKSVKSPGSSQGERTAKPGERLFYESQANHIRKLKQREKSQVEKQSQFRSMPFSPAINQKSRKIAERSRGEVFKSERPRQTRTSQQLREEKAFEECTFKPKILQKDCIRPPLSRDEHFYMLYSSSKIKELKLAEKVELQKTAQLHRKMSETQFADFLRRNQQFASIARKKLEMMKQSADTYDFKTGDKLYSPKISEPRPGFTSSMSPKPPKHAASPVRIEPFRGQDLTEKAKPSTGIFRKKPAQPSSMGFESEPKQEGLPEKGATVQEEKNFTEKYKQYSEEYDRMAAGRESSVSGQEVIPEESEPQGQEGSRVQFEPESLGEENLWASNELRPLEEGKVRQLMGGSEQDEPEPRNNYVLDILSNLINSKGEDD